MARLPKYAPLPAFSEPSEKRSRNMAAIKSADTAPEKFVRKALHAAGFRFRLHRRDIPGCPDLVLPRFRMAVLIHGCFWHGHDCRIAHIPRSNTAYWKAKIARNVTRDTRIRTQLEENGWQVMTLWECTLHEDTGRLLALLHKHKSA